jgi:hypothetical protein
MSMSHLDEQFWSSWTKFEDASQFRAFRAWAIEGSCIEQRMGVFTDVPSSWEIIRPYVEKINTYEQGNRGLTDPEYLKSL